MAGAGYKLFNTGDVLTAAQVNTYLQEQVVMVFASATARTTALTGVLAEGMMSYLQDTNAVEVYNGSAWVSVANAGDITEVTVSSPLTGGGASGSVNVAIQDATTAQKGAVQLEDSTSSTSTTKAATPNSVKSAYDLANAAIPKSLVDAAGDLIYATADNTVARLGIGTAGQVLKVNSGATAPEWGAAAGGGGMTLLETLTLSGSSTTSSTISGDYKHLFITFKNVDMSNSDNCWIRLNGDTGNNYISAQIGLSNTTVQSRNPGAESKIYAFDVTDVSSQLEFARGIIWIPRYTDTDGVFVNICSYGNDSTRKSKWVNAIYDCSAAITSITFGGDSFNFNAGTVYIYGVN